MVSQLHLNNDNASPKFISSLFSQSIKKDVFKKKIYVYREEQEAKSFN